MDSQRLLSQIGDPPVAGRRRPRHSILVGILLLAWWPGASTAQGQSSIGNGGTDTPVDELQPRSVHLQDATERQELFSADRVFEQTRSAVWLLPRSSAILTWLPGSGDDFGLTEWNARTTFRRVVPARRSSLAVNPTFSVRTLDGPTASDVPSRLYDASVRIAWMRRIDEQMGLAVSISPGVYSDLENTGSDAFRLRGFATGTWQYTPEWQVQFGVAVLGREDIPALPVAGLVWTPNEDTRVEIAAPRPRLARRLTENGTGLFAGENWVYFAGEFGGGTWAIERDSGADDEVTLRDFRLLLGFETKSREGVSWQMETGYIFGREIEYESGTPPIEPPDTVLFRTGITY